MSEPQPVLQLEGIVKRYGPVVANDGVDFSLRRGEIHALVGENGAGKTTLMKILFGMERPDAGRIVIDGEGVELHSTRDSIAHGIGMVHQHFMLVPEFTVLDNLTLGVEPTMIGFVDGRAALAAARRSVVALGGDLPLDAVTGRLSVAQQQRLEILKVLHRGARLIILDEPTAVLTPQETEELFTTLRALAANGYSIIFISHKLREVLAVADRVTVIRSGRTTGSWAIQDVDTGALVAAMTGRSDVKLGRVARVLPADEVVLEVSGLRALSRGDAPIADLGFVVRSGEVVGIAGVDGNGQHALVDVFTGSSRPVRGSIRIDGKEMHGLSMRQRRAAGLAYVPEDRHLEGIPLTGTILDGLSGERLARIRSFVARRAFTGQLRAWASGLLSRFSVKAASVDASCSSLSGGNQQKVVIAREIDGQPRCLLLVQPTRGVDLGAADAVYSAIADCTAVGIAVLLISADLDELLRLSDRILVMYRGRIVAEHATAKTSREKIGHDMAGLSETRAA